MAAYSKHKERDPRDTVFKIQSILNDIGLTSVLRWADNPYDGACSNRVTLYPTSLGTNGKGTDELYATASAYAELMERIQNGALRNVNPFERINSDFGFRYFPDEQTRSVKDIVADPDPITADVLPKMGLTDEDAQTRYLRQISGYEGHEDARITVVPFADPVEGKIQLLPFLSLWNVTGSNGMAAGNTLEEAMVQALSEVFERKANQLLIQGKAVPPPIPYEEIKRYDGLYRLCEQVKEGGRYHVEILDCSMGKGWPVAAVCISDLQNGTFGLKLGAHPSFAVALERTLTEALQGRATMEGFTATCRAGSVEEADDFNNIPNVEKVGIGIYPATMFEEEPGWEYAPWTRWEGLDNKGFLQEMLRLLKEEGLHPLFRDTSFLGFPSCYVVVVDFSYMMKVDARVRRYSTTWLRTLECWSHFPELADDEARRMRVLLRFDEYSALNNQTGFTSCRELSKRYEFDRVGAYLCLRLRQFGDASHFFRKLRMREQDPNERAYLAAMTAYARAREWGQDGEQALALVRSRFRKDAADRVCADVADLDRVLCRQFPRMRCYDCARCEAAAAGACNQPAVIDVMRRIGGAMKAENVSQEALLAELSAMYDD